MFTDPENNIAQFGLLPGQRVADLGAGSGFYSIAAAVAVGDAGRVYAVDVQQEPLSRIKSEAAKRHLYNIEIIWGDLESPGGTHLPSAAMDAAIVSNVLFQLSDRSGFMTELSRILKPRGRVLAIDWSEGWAGGGPPADHIFPKDAAARLFEEQGFSIEKAVPAGDSHYGFIARKR